VQHHMGRLATVGGIWEPGGPRVAALRPLIEEVLMLLEDKVAIVSGVGPGLGQANARALAREGATVVLAARNADYLAQVQSEIEAAGGRALAIPTNLVEPDQVDALVARTVGELGQIDVLVNNAFRMDVMQPFDAVDLVKWRKIFEVNVWGALGLTQACLPHLKESAAQRGDASIVFIISMSMRKIRALEGGYSASKAAVQTAAKTMAVELGPSGIRVNSLHPGGITTSMLGVTGLPALEEPPEAGTVATDPAVAAVDAMVSRVPLRRAGRPIEVARMALFLASDESSYCTGMEFVVDGGSVAGIDITGRL